MKLRLFSMFALMALILVLSGCSGTAASSNSGTPQPGTATEVATMPAGGGAPTSTPMPSQTGTATPGASSATPSVTVPGNWKEFSSTQFQVSLNYPPNWTVKETQSGVDLSSPQGVMILLAQVATGGLSAEQYLNQNQLPNTRCTPSTNPHGLKLVTCFDTIARSYSAYMVVKTTQGSSELLSLSLDQQSEVQTFETILASLSLISS